MKTSARLSLLAATLAWSTALSFAAEPAAPKPDRDKIPAPKMRVISVNTSGAPAESAEPVPFLGVETGRAEPALAAQLGLPRGVGLVVNAIVKDTAAVGVLERFDVLTKFEDQMLVSAEQLGVLIRTKAPGDEVSLTFLRGGKEMTAKVKLGERRAPRELGMRREELHERLEGLHGHVSPEALNHLRALADAGMAGRSDGDHFVWRSGASERAGADAVARIVSTGNANVVFSDEAGTVEIKSASGTRVAKVTDASGKVLFDGPLAEVETRDDLPAEVKDRLAKLHHLETIDLEAGVGGMSFESNVVEPAKRKIMFMRAGETPRVPAAPRRGDSII